jgi:calcineurin-like phosphoesterase family protein
MAIHFVADLNFDGNSARYAHPHGFDDIREMGRRICEVWRARVAEGDIVWILGNVGNPVHLAGLPGTKHLVRGASDPQAWNCLSTRRYASVCDSRILETPEGTFFLTNDPASAPEDMRVLHGRAHAGWSHPDHVSVSVDRTGWGPISLEHILRGPVDVRQAA